MKKELVKSAIVNRYKQLASNKSVAGEFDSESIKVAFQLGYMAGEKKAAEKPDAVPNQIQDEAMQKLKSIRKRRERLARIRSTLMGSLIGASFGTGIGIRNGKGASNALLGALAGGAAGYGLGWAGTGIRSYADLDPFAVNVSAVRAN